MSFNKISNFCLIIGLGILVACSSGTDDVSSEQTQSIATPQTSVAGLHAYKDPVTGEFLDEPSEILNSDAASNKLVTTVVAPEIEYSDPKISTVPGGGVYIELVTPPLQEQAFN